MFGAPQGVRGEIRIKSFTQRPAAIGSYGSLTDKSGKSVFLIASLRPLKDDMLVARLSGVDQREKAQALTGVELYARREQLPPPRENEFYYDDLVGLSAVTADGAALGEIVGISNYGAGDIVEIAPPDRGESLLFPFSRAVVPEIDFALGTIVIVPPDEIDGEEGKGG